MLTHQIDPGTNRMTGLSGSQNLAFGYDANGNLTSRGAQGYNFDIGNRLQTAVGKANYAYDGLGRRTVLWFADGNWRLQAYSQAGKLLYTDASATGGTRHVYLGGKLIAETSSTGQTTYVHTDVLGSPVARTDGSGNLISGGRTYYEPYGATAQGATPNGIGFTGHVNDPDTGLVYMQQRYYDPIAGRFLSVDPVTTDAKSGGHFNRYVYGNNNPYTYIDPDGREPCTGSHIPCASGGLAPGYSGSSAVFSGTPQSTGTPGHAAASQSVGQAAASQGAARVHYNQTLSTVTGDASMGAQKPDVSVVWKDGKVSTVEIVSSSQTSSSQMTKGDAMQARLAAIGRAGNANTFSVSEALGGNVTVRASGALGILSSIVRAAEVSKLEGQSGRSVPFGLGLGYLAGQVSREQIVNAVRGGMD